MGFLDETCFEVKRRYIAYFCILFAGYIETSSRFGVTIAMMPGRMVKEDCEDLTDTGELCWSKPTQALVLGAYFWGYTFQFLAVFIAKRFVGYLIFYRLYLVIAGTAQLCYPTFAGISPTLVIFTQVLRGFLAGIMTAYSFRFIAKFSVKNENKALLPLFGAVCSVGLGTGGLIAELMNDRFGWRAYFYFIGALYLTMLCLNLLFVHDNIEQFWYLTNAEKDMMSNIYNAPETEIQKMCDEKKNQETEQSPQTFRDIYCRVYLLAFCVYTMSFAFVFYNMYAVLPFFLNRVLKTHPDIISYIGIYLSLLIAVSVLVFSVVLKMVDKVLPWLYSRLLFTLLPMLLQIVLNLCMSLCTDIYTAIVLMSLSGIGVSTFYSGSIGTLNYELDPENSPLTISVFNSFGQIPGFFGPILMTALTTVEPGAGEEEVRRGWAYFFYSVAGFAGVGIVAVLAALKAKPDEWVNRAQPQCQPQQDSINNPNKTS